MTEEDKEWLDIGKETGIRNKLNKSWAKNNY